MSLLLDRKPVTAAKKLSTLDDALHWVDNHLPAGRIVVSVELDGTPVDAPALSRAKATAIADRQVAVLTGDKKELSLTLLGKLAALIEWLSPQHKAVAAQLEAGQTGPALERLNSILSAWHQIQQAYGNLAKLAGITLKDLPVHDLHGEAVMEEFCQHLTEIQSALTNHDFVLLADILQYEMDAAVANWMSLLEATLGIVDPAAA
jgi:hypothetical protein